MGFWKYIVRNRDEEAWLVNIYTEKGLRTYRYMPDAGMAMQFDTIHEARKTAEKCRGRVQFLRRGSDGRMYGEDVEK